MARIEKSLFTLFFLALLSWAVYVATDWPLRASIIILVLGSVGIALSLVQLMFDLASAEAKSKGIAFDAPALKPEGRWGNLEIWGWILAFYAAIHLIGFPAAVPLFVFAYARAYGASWVLSLTLAALGWGFLYGLFEQILHVPWPKSLLGLLIF